MIIIKMVKELAYREVLIVRADSVKFSVDYADAFTLIDLRPIRPLVFGRRHKALDADLVRTIHGFDAILVMSGSTPSVNL